MTEYDNRRSHRSSVIRVAVLTQKLRICDLVRLVEVLDTLIMVAHFHCFLLDLFEFVQVVGTVLVMIIGHVRCLAGRTELGSSIAGHHYSDHFEHRVVQLIPRDESVRDEALWLTFEVCRLLSHSGLDLICQ